MVKALIKDDPSSAGMTVGGTFSGIGGLELGFHQAGFSNQFLCEINEDAGLVLAARFPSAKLHLDIAKMKRFSSVDVLIGGFPCQDLSAVGTRLGLAGTRSSLINTLFDLVEKARTRPEWIVLENVPFMLQLHRGLAMYAITSRLEELGYRWAYRIVDSRAFGLPQRRRRVFVVATRGNGKPEQVLFADDAGAPNSPVGNTLARGFYWTEGNTGVGWAVDAIPTLKGGSGLSIPSPPAIWTPGDGKIRLPDIRDAERLQGFDEDWTLPTQQFNERHARRRWRQVGNAVSVPVARWVAQSIRSPGVFDEALLTAFEPGDRWPIAGCGSRGLRYSAAVTEYPFVTAHPHLHEYLRYEGSAITQRAANGFFQRVRRTTLKLEDGFLQALAVAAGFERADATRLTPKLKPAQKRIA